MAFPILPAALAVAAVAWAWWLGKNSKSQPNVLEFEDEIVEAAVEILPYKEGKTVAPDAPDILSKIAGAIAKTGAAGPDDLDKVMAHLDPADHQRAVIALIALEFLQWLEQNNAEEYAALALPYRPASVRAAAPARPQLEFEDVCAHIREWHATKTNNAPALPQEIAKECLCTNAKGRPKKLYRDRSKADKVAAYWSKQKGEKQESYPCPENKGFHIRTCRR